MAVNLDNLYYRSTWENCFVDFYGGYHTKMLDFHAHDYYEISLILAGRVKVFLSDHAQEGTECRIVLTSPKTPHFIYRDPDVFYSRLNLLFSDSFVADYVPEWDQLRTVFGTTGRVITLTDGQVEFCKAQIRAIESETSVFRQRLHILCLLSHLSDMAGQNVTESSSIPHYVTGALTYIGEHYAEKILAEELAWRLGVGRTTLMTAFKKHTGSTLGDYLMRCRVKNASRMLRVGIGEQQAAEACGFGDTCGLIRAFKKCYGITPKQYLSTHK
ncbi:MAG: helix-turn-helix transcriptional regulator [Clostridia bacterium]|nr:helix-turn-helix transcriptional regulator [Clostridia bacterium]